MPDTTPQTPPRRPYRAARTTTMVVGVIVGLLAFGLLAVGGVLLWADSKKDEQGYIHTDTERFATRTAAIATDNLDLDSSGPGWLTSHDRYGHMRLEVSSRNGKPVFVGIARTNDVSAYLRGTAHATVTDFHSDPFRAVYRAEPGTARPAPAAPASKPIWVASARGKGTQSVIWDVKHGNWSVVVMNADGSRGVDTTVNAGAKLGFLAPVGWSSLGGGFVLLLAAGGLLYLGVRPPRVPPAHTGATPAIA
jgi:hypothetical protein